MEIKLTLTELMTHYPNELLSALTIFEKKGPVNKSKLKAVLSYSIRITGYIGGIGLIRALKDKEEMERNPPTKLNQSDRFEKTFGHTSQPLLEISFDKSKFRMGVIKGIFFRQKLESLFVISDDKQILERERIAKLSPDELKDEKISLLRQLGYSMEDLAAMGI